jgi:ATP-dependent Clp protease ATP-binding subunit ClpA
MALLEQDGCLARQVLEGSGAQPEAVRERLDRLRLEHVDGLDQDDADALKAIGIDLDEVVRRIDANLGGLAGPKPRRGSPRFTRSSKKVLALALREAISLGHNYIGTEHLLLALVRADDRVVGDTFAWFGVTHRGLRQAVANAVRKAS